MSSIYRIIVLHDARIENADHGSRASLPQLCVTVSKQEQFVHYTTIYEVTQCPLTVLLTLQKIAIILFF